MVYGTEVTVLGESGVSTVREVLYLSLSILSLHSHGEFPVEVL